MLRPPKRDEPEPLLPEGEDTRPELPFVERGDFEASFGMGEGQRQMELVRIKPKPLRLDKA